MLCLQHFCDNRLFKLDEKRRRIIFISLPFFFVSNVLLSQTSVLYRAPMSVTRRGSVRARLHALFTLIVTRALAYPNKWGLEEKRCRICFHYLFAEWHAEIPFLHREGGFLTPGDFYGRDHLERWRAACFRLGRVRVFLVDISRAILSRWTREQLKDQVI